MVSLPPYPTSPKSWPSCDQKRIASRTPAAVCLSAASAHTHKSYIFFLFSLDVTSILKLSSVVWRLCSFLKVSATLQFPGLQGPAVLRVSPSLSNVSSEHHDTLSNPPSPGLGGLEGGFMSTSCMQPTYPVGWGSGGKSGFRPSSPLGTSSDFSPFPFST